MSDSIASQEEADDLEATPVGMVTRRSVYSIRRSTVPNHNQLPNLHNVQGWQFSSLRKTFRTRGFEKLYKRYQQRIMNVHFKAYLIMQLVASVIFIGILLLVNGSGRESIPELVGQLVLSVTSLLAFVLVSREQIIKSYPFIHGILALMFTLLLLTADLGINAWLLYGTNATEHSTNETRLHVPHTLYTILVVYNFMPLASLWQVGVVGCLVGFTHLLFTIFCLHPWSRSPSFNQTIVADAIYYLAINVIGLYSKILNEVTLRRAFYDRRRCVESTFRLEYEKDQETKLMLSILPKHITSKLKSDIRLIVNAMYGQNKGLPSSKGPFSEFYSEVHDDVSILFSDIVNFTPLTVTLSVGDLVETLNDLFGKFDEAADVENCLRIKILGDCYYCVSGIPESTTDHAKNCVQLGLKMIEIIRFVREDRQVNVDMRIGIHSGRVTSGLLGIRKWQFDIWSRDVTVANHMEQSGKPGRVHVSMTTKEKLGDAYDFEPGDGHLRDTYLAKENITTYFVVTKPTSKEMEPNGHQTDAEKEEKQRKDVLLQVRELEQEANHPLKGKDVDKSPISSEERKPGYSDEEDPNAMDSLYDQFPKPLPIQGSPTDPEKPIQSVSVAPTHFPHLYTQKTPRLSFMLHNDDRYADGVANKIKNQKRLSVANNAWPERKSSFIPKKTKRPSTEYVLRRRTVLMDSSLASYRKMQERADSYMKKAIETMPLSKLGNKRGVDQQVSVNLLLFFSDRSWEKPFLHQSDLLYKLYPFGAILMFLVIAAIQLILVPVKHLWFWICYGITAVILLVPLPFLWIPTVWKNMNKTNDDEDIPLPQPKATFWKIIFSFSLNMERSLTWRIVIFLLVTWSVSLCAVIDVISCLPEVDKQVDVKPTDICYYPWYFTYSCALALVAGFAFYRVYFLLKLAFYVVVIVVYALAVVYSNPHLFQPLHTEGFYFGGSLMVPNVEHVLYLVAVALVLHITDRQIEFIHRLDFIWKRRLSDEQEEANITGLVNKTLLVNILPVHVALKYLDANRANSGLYHEQYKAAAVMFASIPDYSAFYAENTINENGVRCLKLLNEIIVEFDKLLYIPEFSRIEKIKVISSTFMAACGLTPGQADEATGCPPKDLAQDSHYLSTLVRFAWAMEEALDKINKGTFQEFRLRIGIDYGPVIAGVVGAQKPLYDIWGNTVNMASRMDYTGEQGKIQVQKSTAILLEQEGIACTLRGETFVKGKGMVVTYWVNKMTDVDQSSSKLYQEFYTSPSISTWPNHRQLQQIEEDGDQKESDATDMESCTSETCSSVQTEVSLQPRKRSAADRRRVFGSTISTLSQRSMEQLLRSQEESTRSSFEDHSSPEAFQAPRASTTDDNVSMSPTSVPVDEFSDSEVQITPL